MSVADKQRSGTIRLSRAIFRKFSALRCAAAWKMERGCAGFFGKAKDFWGKVTGAE